MYKSEFIKIKGNHLASKYVYVYTNVSKTPKRVQYIMEVAA